MSPTVAETLILGLAISSLVVLAFRARDSLRGASLYVMLPLAVAMLGGMAQQGGLLETSVVGAGAAAAAIFGALVSLALRSRGFRAVQNDAASWTQFVPLVLAFYLTIANLLQSNVAWAGDALGRLPVLVYWLALALLLMAKPPPMRAVAWVLHVSLASALLLFSLSGRGVWRSCDIFKCGPAGAIYTGGFASENYLGQVAALSLLLTVTFALRLRLSLVGLPLAVLAASNSRTALAATAVAVLVGSLAYLYARAVRHRSGSVAWTIALGGTLGSVLVLFSATPADFSNRGAVWLQALVSMEERWLFGRGLDAWAVLQSQGELAQHFMHSQALFVGFSGGLMGLVLYATLLAVGMNTALHAPAPMYALAVALGVLLVGLGVLEVVWNPLAVDGQTLLILPFFALMAQRAVSEIANVKCEVSGAVCDHGQVCCTSR